MHKYPIILNYPPANVKRLKSFCRLTDVHIKDFVKTAIENEIAYQLEQMEPDKRKVIEKMLK